MNSVNLVGKIATNETKVRGGYHVDTFLPTSLVGSCAQPECLIDRKMLASRFPPRVRAKELWHVPPESLEEAQDDNALLAIRHQERAGVDIITDGEKGFSQGSKCVHTV